MRLIDADKLIRCLRNDPLFKFIEQFGVTGVIDAQPTVDAVPVDTIKRRIKRLEFYLEGATDSDGTWDLKVAIETLTEILWTWEEQKKNDL